MSFLDDLFKSKQQREQDLKNYYEWAYPFGDIQKQKIEELARTLNPKEDSRFAVYYYLVCRQALAPTTYTGVYQVDTNSFKPAAKSLKKQFNSQGKKDLYKYMALVEADLLIEEDLNYPSLEQLQARAEEIKTIIETK